MAAVHYKAACSRLLHSRSAVTASAISTSFPRKRALRRNYLRHKLLKTLSHPSIPIDSLPFQQVIEPVLKEIQEHDEFENQQIHEFEVVKDARISEPTIGVAVDGSVGLLDNNTILKYGLWLAAAFVFQAVCAVWVFGSADSGSRNGNLDGNRKDPVLEVRENGQTVKLIPNGAVYVDEVGIGREIEEIRAMAREAREKERLKSKNDGLDSEDDDDDDVNDRSGIDLEVDNRLFKLRKKLENEREGTPIALIGHSRKEGERTDGAGESSRCETNGFWGSDDYSIHRPKKDGDTEELLRSGNGRNNAVNLGAEEKHLDLADVDSKENDPVHLVKEIKSEGTVELTEPLKSTRRRVEKERGATNQTKRSAVVKPKGAAGFTPDKSRKSRREAVKSIKSGDVEVVAVSDELSDVSRGKELSINISSQKFGPRKRSSDAELWWSYLPYVLGILMYRGNDDTGAQGLYTLKNTRTDGSLSHIVAFEDSGDATNFCYVLQCYFEDLEDFKADVFPLTVKELKDAVKSETMGAIVVKRGELQLYAGQPLADAEMRLRDIIEQG
ncbi:hypothetical protein F511_26482 [Dorcoceras hygrometricum]|uniref:Uncharacterized protein n=1 Tax=Dorcoceras hygrometricum TaxID=472368 RepID=A0A2Z7ATL0_9LAMI|nr:hypothetical protein F511_26482 [Dorcoceras hygrometricum]